MHDKDLACKGSEEMIGQWSIAIAAGAFVVLVAGILLALHKALVHWGRMQITIEELGKQVQATQTELGLILQPAADTVQAINDQLQSSRKLFQAAEQASEAVDQVSKAAGHLTNLLSDAAVRYVEQSSKKQQKQVDEALQWAEIAVIAWQLWQKGRSRAVKMEQSGQEEALVEV
ncbi:DUF948 domain-containing protein [Paenibacillus sp. IITD108]|uniref:DUF948 domain-containing protein n=2 Tax=unclassified Paenibacillus TaxID=185978 RepID=UPI002F3EDDA8